LWTYTRCPEWITDTARSGVVIRPLQSPFRYMEPPEPIIGCFRPICNLFEVVLYRVGPAGLLAGNCFRYRL
jgi:hypothetical protein